jgi:hypothetical protein
VILLPEAFRGLEAHAERLPCARLRGRLLRHRGLRHIRVDSPRRSIGRTRRGNEARRAPLPARLSGILGRTGERTVAASRGEQAPREPAPGLLEPVRSIR